MSSGTSFFAGYVSNPVIVKIPSVSASSAQINNMGISKNNFLNVPIVQPYGYYSRPAVGSYAVVTYLGNVYNQLFVAGFVNSLPVESNLDLAAGEAAMGSSGAYFLAAKVDRLNYFWQNTYSATPISGEWVNKILIDLINRVNYLEGLLNGHIHLISPDVFTGPMIPQIDPSPDSSLVADANSINAGNTLIGPSGNEPT